MTAPVPPGLDVRGGSGGVVANRADIEHLTAALQAAATALAGDLFALDLARRSVEGELVFGAGLHDPGGGTAVLEALDGAGDALDDGQHGLAGTVPKLRRVLEGYPWGVDVFGGGLFAAVSSALGGAVFVGGVTRERMPVGVPPLDTAGGALRVPGIAAALAPAEDGRGIAVDTGRVDAAPPRSLTDLVRGLDERNRTGVHGGIDVRVLTSADGHRRVVVDITGTRVWKVGGRDVADLTTNELALQGRRTAYEDGVLAALRSAGVGQDDDVMLVGHSQGGMVAVTTAVTAARTGEFHVTHVVTAGSPIAATVGRLPASVRVLALENTGDVVPAADGRLNPDRPSVTTVSAAMGRGAHALPVAYVPLAQRVDASDDRSVRDFLAGADGFLTADRVDVSTYRIERR